MKNEPSSQELLTPSRNGNIGLSSAESLKFNGYGMSGTQDGSVEIQTALVRNSSKNAEGLLLNGNPGQSAFAVGGKQAFDIDMTRNSFDRNNRMTGKSFGENSPERHSIFVTGVPAQNRVGDEIKDLNHSLN